MNKSIHIKVLQIEIVCNYSQQLNQWVFHYTVCKGLASSWTRNGWILHWAEWVTASAMCHRWQRLQTTACRNVPPRPLYKLLEHAILFTSSGPQMFVLMFLRAWPKMCQTVFPHRLNWGWHLVPVVQLGIYQQYSNPPRFNNRRSRIKSSQFLVASALNRVHGLFPI